MSFDFSRFQYILFTVAVFGTGMCGHIPNYSIHNGMTTEQSRFILSMNGISSAVGRLTIGCVADYYGKLLVLKICFIMCYFVTFLWISCTTFQALLVQTMILGTFTGGSYLFFFRANLV